MKIPSLAVTVFALPFLLLAALPLSAAVATDPQPSLTNSVPGTPAPSDYTVVARTLNSRTWQRVTWHTNGLRVVARTNRFQEISTGLHRAGPNGEFIDSSDQLSIQDGAAIATNGQHSLYVPGDIYNDAVRVTLPDSRVLAGRPIGLAFADSQRSVLIAELQPGSVGQVLPSGSQVLWTNICTDITCDLLVSYLLAGVESEVILRERLPDPGLWGFSNNVVVQWWTEWFNPPPPDEEIRVLQDGSTDEFLHFGQMKMVNGKAFLVGDDTSPLHRIPTIKHWVTISNRVCLVEETPLSAIQSAVSSLPVRTAQIRPNPRKAPNSPQNAYALLLPPKRLVARSSRQVQFARKDPLRQPGFSLDWSLLSAQATNYTFTGDSTTLVRGSIGLYGTTTIEGGAVIKLSNNVSSSASLVIYGSLAWKTGPYRMAALTSWCDDSIGETIPGSSANPVTAGWNPAFDLEGNGSPVTWQLNYARFSYLPDGCMGYDGSDIVARNCQFVACGTGVGTFFPIGRPSGNVTVYNALFNGCAYPIWCDQHATAINVSAVGYTDFCGAESAPSGVAITNSILAGPGDLVYGNGDPDNPVPLILDHTTTNTSSAGLFQQVGGGGFYLVDGSTNRDTGTSAIDAQLLADLRSKTTYPPTIVSNAYLGPADVILNPQAQRDTDQIDRGWEYDPLDYCFGAVEVTNCNFVVTPGTAIGGFGTSNATWALNINNGASVSCQGTPTAPVRFAEYSLVQEQTNAAWRMPDYALIADDAGTTGDLQFACRFVNFSCFAFDTCLLGLVSSANSLQDCQFYGGYSAFYYGPIGITNCLFCRHNIQVEPVYNYYQASVCNSLFYGGWFEVLTASGTNSVIRDNLFDRTTATLDDATYRGGYNAYVTNFSRLFPANAHDIILTNTDYRAGPLGNNFYYPTNGGMLSTLINRGSTNADSVGLYHETVMTNIIGGLEIKETNSLVDVGYHVAAVDTNGIPIDTDGDGIPDVLEDLNGNGNAADDLTSWLIYNSRNGLLTGNGLQVFTPLK